MRKNGYLYTSIPVNTEGKIAGTCFEKSLPRDLTARGAGRERSTGQRKEFCYERRHLFHSGQRRIPAEGGLPFLPHAGHAGGQNGNLHHRRRHDGAGRSHRNQSPRLLPGAFCPDFEARQQAFRGSDFRKPAGRSAERGFSGGKVLRKKNKRRRSRQAGALLCLRKPGDQYEKSGTKHLKAVADGPGIPPALQRTAPSLPAPLRHGAGGFSKAAAQKGACRL